MYKIFSVKKNTNFEKEVNKLVNLGFKYIPTFEKEVGIVDFCMDLEVISDGFVDANLFIVVAGFSENTSYQNDNLEEITIEQFRTSITKGYSVQGTGTNRLLRSFGYMLSPLNEYLNEIELAL